MKFIWALLRSPVRQDVGLMSLTSYRKRINLGASALGVGFEANGRLPRSHSTPAGNSSGGGFSVSLADDESSPAISMNPTCDLPARRAVFPTLSR